MSHKKTTWIHQKKIMLTIEPRMINKFWARNAVSFNKCHFGVMFLDYHRTTHH